jgi:hypothetical protein
MAAPRNAVMRELAQGITDLLTAQTFSQNFFAQREYLAVNDIEETDKYLIQVIPGDRVVNQISRATNQHDCTINVTVIRKMIGRTEGEVVKAELVDPIVDFAQEIEDFLGDNLTSIIRTENLKAVPTQQETTMDMERLETLGIVAVNIAVTYTLFR